MTLSVQFSHSVVSVFLWPHELQHTRLPCPSPTSGACSNSCPLSRWCLPTISTSVVPFSSHLQSFPASGSFPMSQLFAFRWPKYGRFSFSMKLPRNIKDWFSSRLTGWISQESSSTPQYKSIRSLVLGFSYGPTLTSIPLWLPVWLHW